MIDIVTLAVRDAARRGRGEPIIEDAVMELICLSEIADNGDAGAKKAISEISELINAYYSSALAVTQRPEAEGREG